MGTGNWQQMQNDLQTSSPVDFSLPAELSRTSKWVRFGYFLPWLVLVFCLASTYMLWRVERQAVVRDARDYFDFRARDAIEKTKNRLQLYQQALRGAQALFNASGNVDREEFRNYVAGLHLDAIYPGIQGIGFAQLIQPAELKSHIATIRRQGFPEYTIKPEGKREFYTSIVYLEPFNWRNQRAFGYDMYSEPVRCKAMEQARDTGQATISGKVALVQETGKDIQSGFLMYLPVYRKGMPHATLAERRASLVGWVYSVFRVGDLMQGIYGERASEFDIHFYDGSGTSNGTLMYDSAPGSQPRSRFILTRHLEIDGRGWTMRIASLPAMASRIDSKQPDWIAGGGIFVSLLITLITWLLVSGRRRSIQLALDLNHELIASKQALQDLYGDLEATMQAIPDLLFDLGENGEYFNIWAHDPDLLAAQKETLLGHTVDEMLPRDAANTVMAALRDAAENGYSHGQVIRIGLPQGERWFELSVAAKADRGVRGKRFMMLSRDITERKLSEKARDRLARAHKFLSESDGLLVRSGNEQELLSEICRLSVETGGYLMAWVGYAEQDDAKSVRVVASSGYEEGYLENVRISWADDELGQGPGGVAIRTGATVFHQDFQNDPGSVPWREAIARRGVRSVIAIPLVVDNRILGIFSAYSAEPNAFVPEEVTLLETLAQDLSYGIETLRGRAAQLSLERESLKNRTLLRNASDGIHILDAEGNLIEASDSFCAMLGYERNEAIGMNVSCWEVELDGTELAGAFKALFARPVGGHARTQIETRHRRKDGSIFDAEVSYMLLELDGKPVSFCSSRDITERKRNELELRKFKAIIESTDEAVVSKSLTGIINSWNHGAERVFGYKAEEAIGCPIQMLVPVDFLDEESEVLARISRGESIDQYETVRVRKDGRLIDVTITICPILDDRGKVIGASKIARDITERKHAEEILRINASVFDNSQEAIVITDADNAITDVNPAFTRITGYAREEVIGKTPRLLSSGRQDKAFYAEMWQSLKQQGTWRGEIWNRRKSGEIYAELLSISLICDDKGKIQRHVGVFSDINYLKEHEAELSRIAHYDALTGIPNRTLLADRMRQAIAKAARDQNMLAVCYLDLDGFKSVNDTLGHEAGDQVLIEMAHRIGNTIRGGDTVARLGGDEFVVLLSGLEQGEECVTTLERLLATIAQPVSAKNDALVLGASIGVSLYPLDDEDPDTLLRHADQAMYVAKQSGKNRFHIYDPEMDLRAHSHNEFVGSVRRGLEQGEFELFYQPKIDLRTQELIGAEALIRWRHPERGLLLPAEFLHPIENSEIDIDMGDWVVTSALEQLDKWRRGGLDIEVSVNISAYHLESSRFVEKLRQQLAKYPGIPHARLQIEVLETAALADFFRVNEVIGACRKFGVSFALDDFGTGYSSLAYLRNLPVDVLKIDQSFVRNMLEDRGDMAIVQGIVALAEAFNRQTVAEGIETMEHYQALLDMGCDAGQGFGIARPMPADELADWRMSQTALEGDTPKGHL